MGRKQEMMDQDLACGEAEWARKGRDMSRSSEGDNVKDREMQRERKSKPPLRFLYIITS